MLNLRFVHNSTDDEISALIGENSWFILIVPNVVLSKLNLKLYFTLAL